MGTSGDPRKRARKAASDPRRIDSAGIAGPGGPRDRGQVIIDTTNAVLLDYTGVALIDEMKTGGGGPLFAVQLAGRINRTQDRATTLFLVGADGIAGLVTELLAVASRSGVDLSGEVIEALESRMDEMERLDAIRPVEGS
jgi:hypothetical protein